MAGGLEQSFGGLLELLGKGIISLTTGDNATGTPEEQRMVQGILGGSSQNQQANPHVNEPIPSAINVMRKGANTSAEQKNLGIGITPQESKIQHQMLQYGAGNVNPFQRGEALSSLNVSDQARNEIATFLPQMSVEQQEVFLQGVRDGKVSEYEVENYRRLRQGY